MSKVDLMELSVQPLKQIRKFTDNTVKISKQESISFAEGNIEKVCLPSSQIGSM